MKHASECGKLLMGLCALRQTDVIVIVGKMNVFLPLVLNCAVAAAHLLLNVKNSLGFPAIALFTLIISSTLLNLCFLHLL